MPPSQRSYLPVDGNNIAGMLVVLAESKEAIRRYEGGEISLSEAIRIIASAACNDDAA